MAVPLSPFRNPLPHPSPPPRFQLVYACGASMALPALQERMDATQALLHVVSNLTPKDPSDPWHQRLREAKAAEWAGPDK